MKYKNWKVPSSAPTVSRALEQAVRSRLLAALLQLRGMGELEDAKRFLNGGVETLHPALALRGMDDAVNRLRLAVKRREHVAVYGDYDVDGITSTYLLSDYLKSQGLVCETYIPDRIDEGYGLHNEALKKLYDMGVRLIVTVDCGITSIEEAKYAEELGLELIITDHHECGRSADTGRALIPDSPSVQAVVDPKIDDSGDGTYYEGAGLAGVGVAFKLACALSGSAETMLERYADVVAVGTVADVMPVTGENRYIIRRGLNKLNSSHCLVGLSALITASGSGDKSLTSSNIGYSLAPRINAAGRLGNSGMALDLLRSRDLRDAISLSEQLDKLNRDRQDLEKSIWQEAESLMEGHTPNVPVVLFGSEWHSGVIGIVASRLTDKYHVPAVMICMDGVRGKGSCRSVGGFNIYKALAECKDCLLGYGGHSMAAGLTIDPARVDEFRERLARYYLDNPPDNLPALEADLLVSEPAFLSMSCVESLNRLEPCGSGNPRPLLYMENALLSSLSPIGGGKHLRLRVNHLKQYYDCVFFNQSAEELGARQGDRVDLIFVPQINEFRDQRSVQLVISDLRVHGA